MLRDGQIVKWQDNTFSGKILDVLIRHLESSACI